MHIIIKKSGTYMEEMNLDYASFIDRAEEKLKKSKIKFTARAYDDPYRNWDRFFGESICRYNENPRLFLCFMKCIDKSKFNYGCFLDYAIKKTTEDRADRDIFINALMSIGIIKEIYEDDEKCWHLKTKKRAFCFYKATDYYCEYPEIQAYLANKEARKHGCHKNALFLLKFFKEGEAITAKIKDHLNGIIYHSYYRYNGKVADLNDNVVMSEDDFNKLHHPDVISVVTFDAYEKKLKELEDNTTFGDLYDLFAIALYQEYIDENNLDFCL